MSEVQSAPPRDGHGHEHGGPPSLGEVAALLARLRALSSAGGGADPVERAAFLTDKAALLARITDTDR